MSKKKNYMPQSTAGLIRYYEESSEGIKVKPEHVVVVSILIVVAEIALKFML